MERINEKFEKWITKVFKDRYLLALNESNIEGDYKSATTAYMWLSFKAGYRIHIMSKVKLTVEEV